MPLTQRDDRAGVSAAGLSRRPYSFLTGFSMSASPLPIRVLSGLSEIAERYDILLCDIWGVVHNGVQAHEAACDAMVRFRQQGGNIVLVSNAPRAGSEIMDHLDAFSVPRAAYDDLSTSGDVTLTLMQERRGLPLHHIGPARDVPMFEASGYPRFPLDEAQYVVCTGLVDDETETPQDYAHLLAEMKRRGLPMLCANPDLVVERGNRLIYCAGALGDAYRDLGGPVLYAGKPYRRVYDMATAKAEAKRGQPTGKARILAVGDAIRTDVRGANDYGVDVVFVTAGIHAEAIHSIHGHIESARLRDFVAGADATPTYVMRHLSW